MRAALVLVVLAGCDPGWNIEGTVVDPSGAPIAGASVALSCPGAGTGAGPVPETVVTDPAGHFRFGGISGERNSDKCTLAISKSGLTPKTIAATDACFRSSHTRNLGAPCAPTDGRVTLTP